MNLLISKEQLERLGFKERGKPEPTEMFLYIQGVGELIVNYFKWTTTPQKVYFIGLYDRHILELKGITGEPSLKEFYKAVTGETL